MAEVWFGYFYMAYGSNNVLLKELIIMSIIPEKQQKRFANILLNNLEDRFGMPICEDRFYNPKDVHRVANLLAKQVAAWVLNWEGE